MAEVPVQLEGYLDELVRRLSEVVELDAVYLFGSAAQGGYEHGRSDVDVIAVTARPSSQAEKEAPFEAAPFGVIGLETAFAALNTHLVEPGLLPLETLLERMSAGPARAYGLEPPRVAVGAPANLVLIDPNASWRVEEEGFRSLSANSWLLGKTLRGRVRMTVADGRVVHEG